MNVVNVFGARLAADAELRVTPSGDKVLSLRAAEDEGFGEKKTTNWYDIELWGARGEKIVQYLKKGTEVSFTGSQRFETFTTRDGKTGNKTKVRLNDIKWHSKGEGASSGGGRDYEAGAKPINPDDLSRPPGGKPNTNRGGGGGGKPAFDQDLDDEIPFLVGWEVNLKRDFL